MKLAALSIFYGAFFLASLVVGVFITVSPFVLLTLLLK